MSPLRYTSLEGNGFKLGLNAAVVLVDPVLVGPLTFGPPAFAWVYSSSRLSGEQDPGVVASDASFVLLTQGLPDHAHAPTLRLLPKALPVVCAPSAEALVRGLGFRDVRVVRPGGAPLSLCGVSVAATRGALVGPPWQERENGYVLRGDAGGPAVYLEPHADCDLASVAAAAPNGVDAVVTPTASVLLAGYPLVSGGPRAARELVRLLRPACVVSLRNDQSWQQGALVALLRTSGCVDDVRAALATDLSLPSTRVIEPPPLIEIELPVRGL